MSTWEKPDESLLSEAEELLRLLRLDMTSLQSQRPRRRLKPGPQVRCNTCGDVVQSMHVHDFKYCKCGTIAVDGGGEYLRMLAPDQASYTVLPADELSADAAA